jgi:hypothetical protein
MAKIPGYCQLCRAEEISRYGSTAYMLADQTEADAIAQHDRACYDAGCKHPFFHYDTEISPEREQEIDKWLKEALGDDGNDYE